MKMPHLSKPALSRRSFLRATGITMALPFLEAMQPRMFAAVAADPASLRRRMVCINTSLGIHTPFLFPEIAGRDYALTPYLEPFGALRSDFTVCSGLSHPEVDGGHAAESSYLTAAPHPGVTGFRNSISLDQYAAENLHADTRFASISLGTGGGTGISWSRAGVPVPSENYPSKVFARLFLNGSAVEVAEQVERLKDGQSIMDAVGGEAKRLGRSLGQQDRDKLHEYFTSVRELETRLEKNQAWVNKPKPVVGTPAPKDNTDNSDIIGRSTLMYDLMALAIQHDSTRLFTFNINGNNSVPPIKGVTIDHHGLSHHGKNPEKIEQLRLIEVAEMQALAAFLTKLKALPEEGGSVLDKTMVFFGSNLGNASSHDNRNMPVLLAGGGFKHGQHLAFDKTNNAPLPNLFVSMLQRLGLEADSFASGKTTLSGLDV